MVRLGLYALLYEASTPYLNIRWCLRDVDMHHTNIWHNVNILFAVIFFIARVLFGSWLTYAVYQSVSTDYCVPLWIRVLAGFNITASYGLNGYWAMNIAKNAMKYIEQTEKKN